MASKPSRRSTENTWLWLIKIATGLIIVGLISVHFLVNHFISEYGLLSQKEIIDYYKNWFVPFMEILFLVTALTHSLIGLRSILMDLNPPDKVRILLTWILIFIGCGFAVYGIWLVGVIASL